VVVRRDHERGRTWRLEIYRFEQGKLVRKLDRDLFEIGNRSAQLVGARLQEIELLLDLQSDGESVRVGGRFRHGGPKGPRNLAPVRTGPPLRWRIAEPPPPAPGGDGGDAGVGGPSEPDAGPADRSPP
jgi:hypothetical protein